LNHGYTTRAFFDQPDNCLFYEYTHLGWWKDQCKPIQS
jgi:hypothetical protein